MRPTCGLRVGVALHDHDARSVFVCGMQPRLEDVKWARRKHGLVGATRRRCRRCLSSSTKPIRVILGELRLEGDGIGREVRVHRRREGRRGRLHHRVVRHRRRHRCRRRWASTTTITMVVPATRGRILVAVVMMMPVRWRVLLPAGPLRSAFSAPGSCEWRAELRKSST